MKSLWLPYERNRTTSYFGSMIKRTLIGTMMKKPILSQLPTKGELKMSVEFKISEEFGYSRCRSCGQKVLWFNVQLDTFQAKKPYIQFHQNPSEKNKAYCPYCGEKELWAENS